MLVSPGLSPVSLKQMSPLVMAYVGDAVFELVIRSWMAADNKQKIGVLHQEVVNVVNAESQANILRRIREFLTEEELEVVNRGRNAKSKSVPKHAAVGDYRLSTGFEALFGYLYLKGDHERLMEIVNRIIE